LLAALFARPPRPDSDIMAKVVLTGLSKVFPGGTVGLDHVDLSVDDGEFVVLVGPSGCGKSTLLRIVAGLEDPSSGTVAIDGVIVNNLAPKARDIAMVFQNYALYPHMTVGENLGFSLRIAHVPKSEAGEQVHDVAHVLAIEPLLDRKPVALSGGQRQRVAMGRAMVRHPKVMLMDEPLSNLDAKLRVAMRGELMRLHQQEGTTTLYVTHDQVEAMTLGDRIAVLNAGRLQQVGTPDELYHAPANVFVAGFIGSPAMNLARGTLMSSASGNGDGGLLLELGAERWPVPASQLASRPALRLMVGREVVVGLRPSAFVMNDPGVDAVPVEAKAITVEALGDQKNVLFLPPFALADVSGSAALSGVDSELTAMWTARIDPESPVVAGQRRDRCGRSSRQARDLRPAGRVAGPCPPQQGGRILNVHPQGEVTRARQR
jgi:multiple sugar transport system ATP-binding protein